jgi:adenine-specific DNA-methyltransferase
MKKITKDDALANSQYVKQANLRVLRELFPEAFSEGHLDPKVLSELLPAGAIDEREEKYGLNWHGKRRARQLALTPSTGTLRPCPEESVDWDTTQNLMIEGDNLEVLKLLQKSYAGKLKLIYIDPPYNTGKDFVYPDDFHASVKNYQMLTGQIDSDGRMVTSNSEASGRFHTDWLSMIYPRLRVARNLLRQDGVIFVSIGDQELARLRLVMDDIFGEENFIANVVWQKKQSPQNDATNISDMHDHILVFAKQARMSKTDTQGWLRNKIQREASQEARYSNRDNDPRGDWTSADLTCNKTCEERPNLYFPIHNPITGNDVWPSKTRVWGYEKPVMKTLLEENRIWWGTDGQNVPRLKVFRSDVDDGVVPSTWWTREFASDNQEARRELRALFSEGDVFDTPKPTRLLQRILEISTVADGSDIIMDFFAGSGTMGHACYDLNSSDQGNRRFILVQLPEPVDILDFRKLSDVTKERLRRAGAKLRSEAASFKGDLGFRVFKLDSSNISAWDPDRENIDQSLLDSMEHTKAGRSDGDLIYELLLKLGLDLCVPIEQRVVAGQVVHSIGAGTLIVCLATKISRDDAEPLALGIIEWHKQLNPAGESTVVFRDSAFADDVAKTNLSAILQQHGLENVRSL